MTVMHRINDYLDCIEIEKEKYRKAKKEMENASDKIFRYQEKIIELLMVAKIK